MTGPEGLALLLLGFWTLLFARALVGYQKTPRPLPLTEPTEGDVVAYVPARNEVEVVEECVQGLLQNHSVSEVVALDDGSEDGTQEVLQKLLAAQADRLRVMSPPAPTRGACGKPSALAFGVATRPASGPWMLFVDADVCVVPGAVAALVELAEAQEWDLVSAIPHQELRTPLEKIVMPTIGAMLLGAHPPQRVSNPDDDLAFANGQMLLVKTAAYVAVGGHASVSHDVLEDVALARRFKEAGYRIAWVDGARLSRTRMYSSWRELTEGWSKNLWLLLGRRSFVWAPLALLVGSAGYLAAILGGWWIGCAVFVAITCMQAWLRHLGRAHPLWAWAAPMGALLATWLLFQSHRHHRRGEVRWKGRSYSGASGDTSAGGHGNGVDR